jgi:hypothetical protein
MEQVVNYRKFGFVTSHDLEHESFRCRLRSYLHI